MHQKRTHCASNRASLRGWLLFDCSSMEPVLCQQLHWEFHLESGRRGQLDADVAADMLQEEHQPFDPPSLKDLSIDDSAFAPDLDVHIVIKELFPTASNCDLSEYTMIRDATPQVDSNSKGQPKPVQRRSFTGGVYSGTSTDASGGFQLSTLFLVLATFRRLAKQTHSACQALMNLTCLNLPLLPLSIGKRSADPALANAIFPLPSPHVRVRKSEALWDLLPPAMAFWESLGLEPASGPKNVMAYCVYPFSDGLEGPASDFLDSIGSAYESCKLGIHLRGRYLENISNGLVPVRVPTDCTLDAVAEAFSDHCQQLGKYLAQSNFDTSTVDSFVIYLINPIGAPQSIMQLCTAFWMLYQRYSQTGTSPLPDIVLQLVPIKYVASSQVPIVLEPSIITALARQVYNRCPPSTSIEVGSTSRIYAAPSIQLEVALPRAIQFKLAADPPSDLLHEFSHLHVGYARSFDGDWVTAAWTDNSGKQHATVSYCLRGDRTFAEVAREIWQTAVEIMQERRVTWRACIARVGVMDREEMEGESAIFLDGFCEANIHTCCSLDLARQQPFPNPDQYDPHLCRSESAPHIDT